MSLIYFGINNIELENRYKTWVLWVEEFKNSEMQYSRLRNLENFIPTTLLMQHLVKREESLLTNMLIIYFQPYQIISQMLRSIN